MNMIAGNDKSDKQGIMTTVDIGERPGKVKQKSKPCAENNR